MLVGKLEEVSIPHEPGTVFKIRLLSGDELDEAADVKQRTLIERVQGLDLSTIRDNNRAPTVADVDPADQYDKFTCINYALVEWSYEEPCVPANKKKLDAKTRDFIYDVIIKKNVRSAGESLASVSS